MAPLVDCNCAVVEAPEERRFLAGSGTPPHINPVWLELSRNKPPPLGRYRNTESRAWPAKVPAVFGRILMKRDARSPVPTTRNIVS